MIFPPLDNFIIIFQLNHVVHKVSENSEKWPSQTTINQFSK